VAQPVAAFKTVYLQLSGDKYRVAIRSDASWDQLKVMQGWVDGDGGEVHDGWTRGIAVGAGFVALGWGWGYMGARHHTPFLSLSSPPFIGERGGPARAASLRGPRRLAKGQPGRGPHPKRQRRRGKNCIARQRRGVNVQI
jgi:hypothetical protein